jgi:hypothetical protein
MNTLTMLTPFAAGIREEIRRLVESLLAADLVYRLVGSEIDQIINADLVREAGKAGGKYRNLVEVAHEATDWILENQEFAPLPGDLRQALARIVAAAEKCEQSKPLQGNQER